MREFYYGTCKARLVRGRGMMSKTWIERCMIRRVITLGFALAVVTFSALATLPALAKTHRIKKVGEYPNFLALSLDGKTAYVTSYGSGELVAVDLIAREVSARVTVGGAPLGIAVTADTAYVACKDSGTVAVIDLQQFRVKGSIKVGASPNSVAVGSRGYRLFVTDFGRTKQGQVHVIDIREGSVIRSHPGGHFPYCNGSLAGYRNGVRRQRRF